LPVATFEKLCRVCLETGPGVELGSLPAKMAPTANEILSSHDGMFAIIRLLEMLDDPRWGYAFREVASTHSKITANRLIACLQKGAATSAKQSVRIFCRLMKDSYGRLFASAFTDTLTSSDPWDTNGLAITLSVLDTTDKKVLPHLARYKEKIDLAKEANTGKGKQQFAALSILVRDTMWRIKGRQKWWQFWKS
jgi:hypothetical protein